MPKQLDLDLNIKHDASLSDFNSPNWASIIDMVRQLHAGLIQQLYLYGEQDVGKTHLLLAISESFRDIGSTSMYLSLRELVEFDPSILSSLETIEVIVIDDMDAIQGNRQWQEAVFHLINLTQEFGNRMIFASRLPVNQLDFELRDLLSRLSKSPTFQLPSGSDRRNREAILQSVLNRRHWQFDTRITDYLLSKGPLRVGAMLAVLSQLQPLFSNLERSHVTKAKIAEACKIIDEQTLLYEIQGLQLELDNEDSDFLDF